MPLRRKPARRERCAPAVPHPRRSLPPATSSLRQQNKIEQMESKAKLGVERLLLRKPDPGPPRAVCCCSSAPATELAAGDTASPAAGRVWEQERRQTDGVKRLLVLRKLTPTPRAQCTSTQLLWMMEQKVLNTDAEAFRTD